MQAWWAASAPPDRTVTRACLNGGGSIPGAISTTCRKNSRKMRGCCCGRSRSKRVLRRRLPARKQQPARVAPHHIFAQRLWARCQPFAPPLACQHTVCERRERFLPEMCALVAFACCACSHPSRRAPCAPSGDGSHHQQQLASSQRRNHSHGARKPLWHLDGSGSASSPSMRGSASPDTLPRSCLNTYP